MKQKFQTSEEFNEWFKTYEFALIKGIDEPDSYPCIAVYEHIEDAILDDCDDDEEAIEELCEQYDMDRCDIDGTLFITFVYPSDFE